VSDAINISGSTAIRLDGNVFGGWAMFRHLVHVKAPSGGQVSRRSVFAEILYRYRFVGEMSLLERIAKVYATGIEVLFTGETFDCIIMPPAPLDRPEYTTGVRLVSEISLITGLLSMQHAVIRALTAGPDNTRPAFKFASDSTEGLLVGKRVLVITDFVLSGRTLESFCAFLKSSTGATGITVLAGTAKAEA
jgi:predicted amidophosphoribosyltransferase